MGFGVLGKVVGYLFCQTAADGSLGITVASLSPDVDNPGYYGPDIYKGQHDRQLARALIPHT